LIEELRNLIFIDFKKAFVSIIRDKMFLILEAYGIPAEIVHAIKTTREKPTEIHRVLFLHLMEILILSKA